MVAARTVLSHAGEEAIGLPRQAFTPVFAIARAPSWIAHALEQQKTSRMIRPRSIYIGPSPAT